jgi:hypothetical protein
MAAIDAIVFAVAAGFAFAVLVTVIVIIGVHREEHRRTLTKPNAPGAIARLARFVLGWNIRDEYRGGAPHPYDDEYAEALDHRMSTRI